MLPVKMHNLRHAAFLSLLIFMSSTRWPELVQRLLEDHYDLSYAYGWGEARTPLAIIALDGHSEHHMDVFYQEASAVSARMAEVQT